MEYNFRKATTAELNQIWKILQGAIERRKADGSNQWQDGYPNPEVIRNDIEKGVGFVLTEGETVVGYTAVLINDEPEYARIEGKWLTDGDFVVFHRVAISEAHLGKGLARKILDSIEAYALSNNIYSIKADTNFDNAAMLKTFEKAGYVYCGEVYFKGSPRKAFEKVLTKSA
ncbi:L-amino acid N-acyltransferase YncA [Pontibacter ummariensis]|uniref:L-amino acid N-acyltransferase YncA n=1 Tax=Pontibacter ummariensis TaxID=1610492 RepID=A0A239L897_9BACT|nr:GNAT family N-acetyltransferase [Pontibacter ummariensis]PRY04285.1 L-amino acid N-acyltransferase YncA [Pontibacter ummariensis]SNT25754.1 L-amino acid N-acyltransferase YncA [Pontibacter ummariensis]